MEQIIGNMPKANVVSNDCNSQKEVKNRCTAKVVVYSRVCGFYSPVCNWNHGKKEEFIERLKYKINNA